MYQLSSIIALYLTAYLPIAVVYGIIIKTVESGRCFRFEYFIKKVIITGLLILCVFAAYLFSLFAFRFLFFMAIPILIFFDFKYTIQRFYDLGLSGWCILLKTIPPFSSIITLALFFIKGNYEINKYDKPISYRKLVKHKNYINIFNDKFVINNDEEYQYERHLNSYRIKISKYGKENFFTVHLQKNYPLTENYLFKIIEITIDDFEKVTKELGLIVIIGTFYLCIKDFEIFIRKENSRYAIILEKQPHEVSKEACDVLHFPGSFYEDEKYMYYNKISKDDLLTWVKTSFQ